MSSHYYPVLVLMCVLVFHAKVWAQESTTEVATSSPPLSEAEKQKCVEQLLDWCKNKEEKNSSESFGVSIMSTSFFDGKTMSRIFCSQDSNGIECRKNQQPWFHCFPNATLTYKDNVLSSPDSNVDDDICEAKEKALKFGSEMGFNKTAFEEEMHKYKEEMEDFFKEFGNLHKIMRNFNQRIFPDTGIFLLGENTPSDSATETETVSRKEINP